MQKVTVRIGTKGEIEVEVDGVVGKGCEAITADIEEALGKRVKQEKKPEYHRKGKVGQQARAGN